MYRAVARTLPLLRPGQVRVLRSGDPFRDKERAAEDAAVRKHDEELLEKLRQSFKQQNKATAATTNVRTCQVSPILLTLDCRPNKLRHRQRPPLLPLLNNNTQQLSSTLRLSSVCTLLFSVLITFTSCVGQLLNVFFRPPAKSAQAWGYVFCCIVLCIVLVVVCGTGIHHWCRGDCQFEEALKLLMYIKQRGVTVCTHSHTLFPHSMGYRGIKQFFINSTHFIVLPFSALISFITCLGGANTSLVFIPTQTLHHHYYFLNT